ncbi:hypothetical protein OSTOST_16582 [Ostertagia ostertagi]
MSSGHISAAENTIDGFEDISLEQRSITTTTANTAAASADTSKPRVLVEKERNAINMNDIMMDEILGDDKHDDVDAVVEDAISISTNVIEEVDETELSRLRLHPSCEVLLPAKPSSKERLPSEDEEDNAVFCDARGDRDDHDRDHNDHDDREEISEHDNVVVKKENLHLSVEMPSTSKENDEKEERPKMIEGARICNRRAPFASRKEVESGRNSPKLDKSSETLHTLKSSASPSVIQIVPKEDAESDNDEEIIISADVTPTVQKPFDPPPVPATKSIMYADTSSSEEESDDEASREVLPPVQRSQRIMNIDQLRTDQLVNGRIGSDSTLNGSIRRPLDTSSSSDDDDYIREISRSSSKEISGGAAVTRIVVRENGLPDVLSSGGVKLNVETITDEEFSEKLI